MNSTVKYMKMGLFLGLATLLVACGNGESETEIDADNSKATVTVEEVSEGVQTQTEEWEEVDEETGEEFRVTVVKHIEDGKVIRSSQSRELLNGSEDSESAEVESTDVTSSTDGTTVGEVIETKEDLEKHEESGVVATLDEGKVVITNAEGEVVEELTVSGYDENQEEE